MSEFPITVWHNPACGTSRSVLAMVREAGHEPQVVEYLQTGWDAAELRALLAQAGLTPRQALREKGSPAAELGLLAEGVGDEAILDAMVRHPMLVNRPLVRTPKGVRMTRPAEIARELL